MSSLALPIAHRSAQPDKDKLWPVVGAKSSNEDGDKATADGVLAGPVIDLDHQSPALCCSKDDNLRKGVCCRDLKPSDQRTVIDPDIIRDVVIGLSDGLTVPFALTAGLSSLGSSRFVILGGVAELISGAISMGVGVYFSTQAEIDHYHYQARQVHQRVSKSCQLQMTDEIVDILEPYGASYSLATSLSTHLWKAEQKVDPSRQFESSSLFHRKQHSVMADEKRGLTNFLIQVGSRLEPIAPSRPYIGALTVGFSYLAGGLVPLLPYIIIRNNVRTALFVSIGVTAGFLIAFGIVKQHYSGAKTGFKGYTYGAISTLAVGGVAAAASWGIVRAIERTQGTIS